jgi:hypothetical protein
VWTPSRCRVELERNRTQRAAHGAPSLSISVERVHADDLCLHSWTLPGTIPQDHSAGLWLALSILGLYILLQGAKQVHSHSCQNLATRHLLHKFLLVWFGHAVLFGEAGSIISCSIEHGMQITPNARLQQISTSNARPQGQPKSETLVHIHRECCVVFGDLFAPCSTPDKGYSDPGLYCDAGSTLEHIINPMSVCVVRTSFPKPA